ncbi:MAG TPA: Gfo/Idh/MocA family oxidoreductase [Bryobacteraceae bacterium]|nr:Gfo/Idh/MocA family oxidoreductase [Bryobacteraceae bacterium]
MSSSIGVGLIGYGAWGKYHAQAIQSTPGCELRAIVARSESTRKEAAETGAAVYESIPEMVKRNDIQMVDIVAPNHVHEAAALAAIEHGKHVLLEKPMSTSTESCDRILEAARKAGVRLLIGHEMRFSPLYATIRQLIDSGRIGEPRYVLIDLWRRPYRSGSDGWRLDPARVGNWILEEPVHYFDVASWYLDRQGAPRSVYAWGNQRKPTFDRSSPTNDNFTAMIQYANGAYAVISHSLCAVEYHISIKVFGEKAALRAEWHAELDRSEHPEFSLEISEGDRMTPLVVPGTPGEHFELKEEIAAMVRAVRDGGALPITPEEGRRAVALCQEAIRSLATGQVVQLDRAAPGAGHGD